MDLSWVRPLFPVWSFLGSSKPASCSISIIPYHPRSVVHGVEASPGQRSLGPAEGCSLLSPMQLIAGGLHSARQRWEHHCSLHWLWRNCETLLPPPSSFCYPGFLGAARSTCFNEGPVNTRTNQKHGSPSRGEAQGWQQNLRSRGMNAGSHWSRDAACAKEPVSLTAKVLRSLGTRALGRLLSDMEYMRARRPWWTTEFKSLIHRRRNWSPGHCD